MQGALMVCGTASDVGKSRLVAGLCRILARQGVAVAPFKAQNMSLNSTVTRSGHEIARSIAHQAVAARTEPAVEMNPILLKPSGERTSQLILMGQSAGEITAGADWPASPVLAETVLGALSALRRRYGVVVLEGAGGAAEINLLARDLANLPLAAAAGLPAVLVGDIERGGVFAAIYGTVALLPKQLRSPLRGFVVNKFRGDPQLLAPGIAELEHRLQLPCFGVLPHLGELAVDEEDSLALGRAAPWSRPVASTTARLDAAVVALPHLSNFTDFDPLRAEEGVALRYVAHACELGDPDLVILPGSKTTVLDLEWLRAVGLDRAIAQASRRDATVLGICAGYQMLGTHIFDEVESRAGEVAGLGLLEVRTSFAREKTTRWRQGTSAFGELVAGYEIHHGRPVADRVVPPFLLGGGSADEPPEGVADHARAIFATSLHGLFENDGFRRAFLSQVASRRNKDFKASPVTFAERREAAIERVADALEAHLDLEALFALFSEATRGAR